MTAKQTDDFVRFALPHEAVIDEHAGELIADRLVDQHRRDRGIDAARQAADHPRFADLSADTRDLLVAESGHRPVALEAGDLEEEVREELRAIGRMNHLGVEHRRVIAALLIRRDGVGRVLRHRIDPEAFRQARHAVAMAHPDRIAPARPPHAVEQGAGFEDLDIRPAEFRRVAALHLAAELLAQASAGRSRWRGWGRRPAKISDGARGLPASGTEAGPPDRITAFGLSRANASAAFENGWISQKTPASRTRRAISCVTCEPKSTMRTKS